MKVYIAAPYPAREYVESLFPVFAAAGHEITSTWATGTREINVSTVGPSLATAHHDLVRHVEGDLYDIARAKALVSLTAEFCIKAASLSVEDPAWYHTGGRHVELGYALAIQQHRSFRIFTVGEPENVFQRGLTSVVPDLPTLLQRLG